MIHLQKIALIFTLWLTLIAGCFSPTKQIKVCTDSGIDCVYFNYYARGLNYEEIFISNSSFRTEANREEDYVFDSSSTLFYKMEGNTLKIYHNGPQSIKTYNNPNDRIRIVVNGSDSGEVLNNIYDTYNEKGLKRFP